jgi:hypothetical protein
MNYSVFGVLVIVACLYSLMCVSLVLCTAFEYYTDQWAVEIDGANETFAKDLARRHGFTYVTTVRLKNNSLATILVHASPHLCNLVPGH